MKPNLQETSEHIFHCEVTFSELYASLFSCMPIITMKPSSADQEVTFSLVSSYYCHGHESEKAK